jgi:stage II sporulation protein D
MTAAAPPERRTRRAPVTHPVVAAVVAVLFTTGTWPGTAPPVHGAESVLVRVGILVDRPSVRIGADGPVTVEDVSTAVYAAPAVAALPPSAGGAGWVATANAGGGLDLSGVALGPALRLTAQGGLLRAEGRPYRGAFELRRTPGGHVTLVNVIDLESYLYGVIKGEMEPRWPREAVRAQAVAARTLAVHRMLAAREAGPVGFDLPATTDAQVYLGVAAEDPATTAAVEETRGLVVTYEGRPIFAAYHSNSGGHTEDSENVWGTPYPYLRGVADPYALEAPGVSWSAALPFGAIADDLHRGGIYIAGLTDVVPGRVTPWGRVVTIVLRDDAGRNQEINANRFRLLVGPSVVRSTMFGVARQGLTADFAGRGSGHGVGLDQWGARALAVRGFTFEQILKYYYAGVAVQPRF